MARAAAKTAKKAAAAKTVLTERQQKWFASVEASLERDTGKTLAEWVKLAKKCPEATPGKRTQWMREKYGLGANRIAHIMSVTFPDATSWDDPDALLDQLWTEPEGRAIYEDLAPGAADFARHIVDAIDPADRPAFERALQQIIRASKPLAGDLAGDIVGDIISDLPDEFSDN